MEMFNILHQHSDLATGIVIYLVIAIFFFLGIWVNRNDTWSMANIIENDRLYNAPADTQLLITLRMALLWPVGFIRGACEFIDSLGD